MVLFQCKEEIKIYIGVLEEFRDKYDRDIRYKEEMVIMFFLFKVVDFNIRYIFVDVFLRKMLLMQNSRVKFFYIYLYGKIGGFLVEGVKD